MSILTLLIAAIFGIQGAGQSSTAVPTQKGSYLCNYAKVKQLQSSSHLIVRSGPGMQFPSIDQLGGGAVVYTCDEHRDWLKIYYSDANGPCGAVVTLGLDVKMAQTCKSGWANRKFIETISG